MKGQKEGILAIKKPVDSGRVGNKSRISEKTVLFAYNNNGNLYEGVNFTAIFEVERFMS